MTHTPEQIEDWVADLVDEARRDLVVRWPGGERRFRAGERLHTENSYKWQADGFAALLRQAGFAQVQTFTDPQGWFAVMLASHR